MNPETAELCRQLGLEAPRYDLIPWSGRPAEGDMFRGEQVYQAAETLGWKRVAGTNIPGYETVMARGQVEMQLMNYVGCKEFGFKSVED